MRLPVLAAVGCLIVTLAARASVAGASANPITPDGKGADAALAQATHDLCHRRFALLGEGPTHGDGATESFKVALVERLIDQCGYRNVVFEASQYEFFKFNKQLRTGQPVALGDLEEAVGGLRRNDRELRPLLSWLLERARTGQIHLAGLDDQIGGLGDTYANDAMIPELVAPLPSSRQKECAQDFHRRAYSEYPDDSPYSNSDQKQLLSCLDDMSNASHQGLPSPSLHERGQMLAALQRNVASDQLSGRERRLARDKSMFETLNWLRSNGNIVGKTIIWAATVHLAKQDLDAKTAEPLSNFGSLMHSLFGQKAFVLGFSALSGSTRLSRSEIEPLPTAQNHTLESDAFMNTTKDVLYLGPKQLISEASKEGAAVDHTYQRTNWANTLDGLILFRDEYPTHRLPS